MFKNESLGNYLHMEGVGEWKGSLRIIIWKPPSRQQIGSIYLVLFLSPPWIEFSFSFLGKMEIFVPILTMMTILSLLYYFLGLFLLSLNFHPYLMVEYFSLFTSIYLRSKVYSYINLFILSLLSIVVVCWSPLRTLPLLASP